MLVRHSDASSCRHCPRTGTRSLHWTAKSPLGRLHSGFAPETPGTPRMLAFGPGQSGFEQIDTSNLAEYFDIAIKGVLQRAEQPVLVGFLDCLICTSARRSLDVLGHVNHNSLNLEKDVIRK